MKNVNEFISEVRKKTIENYKSIKQKLDKILLNLKRQPEPNKEEEEMDSFMYEEEETTFIENDIPRFESKQTIDWSLNFTLIFLLLKILQIMIQIFNLKKENKPCQMGDIVITVLTDRSSQNMIIYIGSNVMLIALFYSFFANLTQYFSVPELRQHFIYI